MNLAETRQNADYASDEVVVDAINRKLNENFRVLDGRPIYRIVWSEHQYEKRKGTYTDWYGNILIREEKNIVREVKKYWYFSKPSWVIEKLVFFASHTEMKEVIDELVESRNGSYECVYRFHRVSTGQNLPVTWRIVDFIVWTLHNPGEPVDVAKAQAIEEAEEVAYFEEELGKGERSPLFTFENSAFVSQNQMSFRNSRPVALEIVKG